MAIVYSYPTATPELQDLLIGVEKSLVNGEDQPRTRNFTIDSISSLISAPLTTAINLKANITSPSFLGTPSLPAGTIGVTQAAGNSTTALATTSFVTTANNLKVDKVAGKGLSTEDYTTAEKNKLAGITGTNTGDQNFQAVTNLGSITTAIIGAGGFVKTGGTNNQFLKANGAVDESRYVKNIIRTSYDGNPSGGTTAIVIKESTLIPGGTFIDKDSINLLCFYGKTNSNAPGAIYIYINSVSSLQGATQIGYYSFPDDLKKGQFTRKWILYGPAATARGFYNGGVSSSTGTEDVTSNYYPSEFSWDTDNPTYLIVAMQMGSANDGSLYYGTNLTN